MSHLLVTNDFPPKVGGIQSYLWELWRRLPPDSFAVLTTPYPGSADFDAKQEFRVDRVPAPVLVPSAGLVRRVRFAAEEVGAGLVVLDPALPVGLIGPRLGIPYGVILHGAEVTVPSRLPGVRRALAGVLRGASWILSGGAYPTAEARELVGGSLPPVTVIPPGVDTERFRPLDPEERAETRERWRFPQDARLVVSVSRLVPRKGMDTLIEAAGTLSRDRPDLLVAIVGQGRDRGRLAVGTVRSRAPVRLLGAVAADDLPRLYGCADLFAMLCRDRWGGLEKEGFGIVFLEAAAAGLPQVAGDSGGAREAVSDGITGLLVSPPGDPRCAHDALARLLDDHLLRGRMGETARLRAMAEFDYDALAKQLQASLAEAPY